MIYRKKYSGYEMMLATGRISEQNDPFFGRLDTKREKSAYRSSSILPSQTSVLASSILTLGAGAGFEHAPTKSAAHNRTDRSDGVISMSKYVVQRRNIALTDRALGGTLKPHRTGGCNVHMPV
jgi:hypothetical protein